MRAKQNLLQVALLSALSAAGATAYAVNSDFGAAMDADLTANAATYFGFSGPLASSASTHTARGADNQAADLIDLASGLSATILTRNAANKTDMMAFWPLGAAPTHIITCVEGGTETLADGKLNPSIQRIDLITGEVGTILRGMDRCDGIRTTPWGSILATEESSDGGAYELIDPLNVTNYVVLNRAIGQITQANGEATQKVVKREALPTMSWEGLEVLPNGVVIGGDELRPGSIDHDGDGSGDANTDGGALFKFVPSVIRTGTGQNSDLAESPLTTGNVYALQVSCVDSKQQVGQGCEVGNGSWVKVDAANARKDADLKQATGYYRPEDLHLDPTFTDADNADAVRFCWTNTGNEGAKNYGEVVCGVDSDPALAGSTDADNDGVMDERSVVVNRFVEGDKDFNSVDNLAFQPGTGILYVIEDHQNGDVFACLPDGADRDIKSDGCVKMLSVKDQSAEPTGFTFSPDGLTAYVSIQHSNDPEDGSMDVDGYGTDDVLKVTGFAMPWTAK